MRARSGALRQSPYHRFMEVVEDLYEPTVCTAWLVKITPIQCYSSCTTKLLSRAYTVSCRPRTAEWAWERGNNLQSTLQVRHSARALYLFFTLKYFVSGSRRGTWFPVTLGRLVLPGCTGTLVSGPLTQSTQFSWKPV